MKAPEFKDFELPQWNDEKNWKNRFKYENGKVLDKKFNTFEEMREHCYGLAANEETSTACDPSVGWCLECMRSKIP